jgi:fatty acid desaturase
MIRQSSTWQASSETHVGIAVEGAEALRKDGSRYVVSIYRIQHLAHHRDFELQTADRFDYLLETLRLSRGGVWARTWLVFIKPLLGHAGYAFLADTVTTYRDHSTQALRLVLFWSLLVATAWWLGWLGAFALYWIVPLVWLYPVFDIWAELSDHLDADGESRNQEGLFYSALLKGHETFHAVHHLYPAVPYYRLRDLNRALLKAGIVFELSRGPLGFLRIVYWSSRNRAVAGPEVPLET